MSPRKLTSFDIYIVPIWEELFEAKLNAVECKQNEHCMNADPLVSIHKGMIHDESITEPYSPRGVRRQDGS